MATLTAASEHCVRKATGIKSIGITNGAPQFIHAQGASTGFQVIAPAFPLSKASSAAMSSSLSSKSYTCELVRTRSGRDDFGSGTKLSRNGRVSDDGLCMRKRSSRTRAEGTSESRSGRRPCCTTTCRIGKAEFKEVEEVRSTTYLFRQSHEHGLVEAALD